MHFSSVVPRTFCEAGEAQAALSVSRFGPTVPVVPAADSVWHDPHEPTPVKIVLPTAGVGLTFWATAAASAPVSWPGTSIGGITPWVFGNSIQYPTSPAIEVLFTPSMRSWRNASSRFGPTVP